MTINQYLAGRKERRKERRAQSEFNDSMFDDSRLTGWQRLRRGVRDNWDALKWPLLVPAIMAPIYLAGFMGTARVKEFARYDVNHDGVEDVIMAYPIKGTSKALMGYLDGNRVPELTDVTPALSSRQEYLITWFDFNRVGSQLIENPFNN